MLFHWGRFLAAAFACTYSFAAALPTATDTADDLPAALSGILDAAGPLPPVADLASIAAEPASGTTPTPEPAAPKPAPSEPPPQPAAPSAHEIARDLAADLATLTLEQFMRRREAADKLDVIMRKYPNPLPKELGWASSLIRYARWVTAGPDIKYQAVVVARWFLEWYATAPEWPLPFAQQVQHIDQYMDFLRGKLAEKALTRFMAQDVMSWALNDPCIKEFMEYTGFVLQLRARLHQMDDPSADIVKAVQGALDDWQTVKRTYGYEPAAAQAEVVAAASTTTPEEMPHLPDLTMFSGRDMSESMAAVVMEALKEGGYMPWEWN